MNAVVAPAPGAVGHALAAYETGDGLVAVRLEVWIYADASAAGMAERRLLNEAHGRYPGALVTSTEIGVPCNVVDGSDPTVGRVRMVAVWSHAQLVEQIAVSGDQVDYPRLYLTNMARNQDSRSYRFLAPPPAT